MTKQTVLVSGAGIAGPTLAHRLARHGLRATVVERAGKLRSSGSPVDVRGPALDVAREMGVVPRLREAATDARDMTFVDGAGRTMVTVPVEAIQPGDGGIELPRGDLAAILQEAARDDAELIFGDSIAAMEQDEGGVDVTFDQGPPRRFDLVVGADGLHSNVRRLAFGPESDLVRHMGLYIATIPLGEALEDRRTIFMCNAPGRSIAIHPCSGHPGAAFIFRSPALPGFDHRDMEQHRRLLAEAFAGMGWRAPELLERARASDDLYFDSVSQVRLRPWSRGRIALLGDAAASLSLFGDGSTLAMAGAATLADALGASPRDHEAAFREYEARHWRLVEPRQRSFGLAGWMMVPGSRFGIATRNLALRALPLMQMLQRRPRRGARPSVEGGDAGGVRA